MPPKFGNKKVGSGSADCDSDSDDDDSDDDDSDDDDSLEDAKGPPPIPLWYKQETNASCAQASVRMVLQSVLDNERITEKQLREESSLRPGGFSLTGGTFPVDIPKMLADHGLPGSELKNNGTMEDIKKGLAGGKPVIIMLVNGPHFVVVDKVTTVDDVETLRVRDPWEGDRTIPPEELKKRMDPKGNHLITLK